MNRWSENYRLSNEGFRVLIMAKALFNIIYACNPAINQLLLNLFPGRGNAYVVDNRNMSMSVRVRVHANARRDGDHPELQRPAPSIRGVGILPVSMIARP